MEPTRKIEKVSMRNLHMEDYDQLAKSFKRIYADSDVFWTKEQIKKLITIFPEGQVVIIVDDKIVGCALSIILSWRSSCLIFLYRNILTKARHSLLSA